MTDQDLLRAIQNDDTQQMKIAALREELEAETERTDSELDIDRINRITAEMDRIAGTEHITAEKAQQGIKKLKSELYHKKQHTIRRFRWIAACACFLLIASNIWSYSVYGINSFSAAYQLFNGGVTIDFHSEDDSASNEDVRNIEKYQNNPFLDDMREKCKEHGLDVLLPTYIPEGFTLTMINDSHADDENYQILQFFFKSRSAKLNLDITQFSDESNVMPLSIPSDSHNISPQKINGQNVHIQKENQQYWAVFQSGLTQYVLYTDRLDYEESQRVLESMLT